MRLFGIRDLKGKCFINCILDKSAPQAERNFKTAVNNNDTDFSKYPEDFQLFELASFDLDTGQILPHSQPLLICDAASLKQ